MRHDVKYYKQSDDTFLSIEFHNTQRWSQQTLWVILWVTTYLMRKKSSYLLIWGWFDWIFYKLHIASSLYSYWYNSAIVIVKKRNELGFYLIDPEGSTQRDKMIFPLIYISRIKLMSNPAVADMFFQFKCIFLFALLDDVLICWW